MSKPAPHIQVKSVDDKLAEHLKIAEHHLIEAVKLLSKSNGPKRNSDYVKKLTRAQETITTLMREELVRIRGVVKVGLKGKGRKFTL